MDTKFYDWDTIGRIARRMTTEGYLNDRSQIFGIPRGGGYLVAMLAQMGYRAVSSPVEATILIDDVINSGATARRWQDKFELPIFAAVGKGAAWRSLPMHDDIPPRIIDQLPADQWVIFPWEDDDPKKDAEDIVRRMIEFIGDDVNRPGLIDTPRRVVESWRELFKGYRCDDPEEIIKLFRIGDTSSLKRIEAGAIPFRSTCEHHLMPFTGSVKIAYEPSILMGVIGISKLARLVDVLASRLQIQERLTVEIASVISPWVRSVEVEIEASHACINSRGVRAHGMMLRTRSDAG